MQGSIADKTDVGLVEDAVGAGGLAGLRVAEEVSGISDEEITAYVLAEVAGEVEVGVSWWAEPSLHVEDRTSGPGEPASVCNCP